MVDVAWLGCSLNWGCRVVAFYVEYGFNLCSKDPIVMVIVIEELYSSVIIYVC